MIGSKHITIDWKNLVLGMTTNTSTEDGGFSIGPTPTGTSASDVTVFNPIVKPGVIHFPALAVDKSTNLTGQMMASVESPAVAYHMLGVSTDSDQDGRFFSIASDGTLTARGSEDTSHNYIYGRTDIIGYKGEAYITTDSTIVRWSDIGGANTFNTSFFSFADSLAPHPAIVFEDNAYYGDGNELLRQTSAGGTPAVILTLPVDQVIVSLGIDPGSGLMLVSVVNQYNVSGTIPSRSRVGYYDGFSNKFRKVVIIDEMINSFFSLEGTTYVTYGKNFGYWTGSGVKWLRTFNLDYDNTELLYKHHITSVGSVMYFIEKHRLVGFGEIVKGSGKCFWYYYSNHPSGSATDISHVAHLGSGVLAFSYATSQFFTVNTLSTSNLSTTALFHTLEYHFPKPVNFANVTIDYEAPMTQSTNMGSLSMYTDTTLVTINSTLTSTRTDQTRFTSEYSGTDAEVSSFMVRYVPLQVLGISSITIFYDPKE